MTYKGKSPDFLCGAASVIIRDLLADPTDAEARKIAEKWLEGYKETFGLSHLTLRGTLLDAVCRLCGARLLSTREGLRCPNHGLLPKGRH